MNNVQRNFKRQMKEIEQEQNWRWRKEEYRDNYTGKKMVRYYDVDGRLMKTEEKQQGTGHKALKVIFVVIMAFVVVSVVLAYLVDNVNNVDVNPNDVITLNSGVNTNRSANITVVSKSALHVGNNLNINVTLRNDSEALINHIKVYINVYDKNYKIIAMPTSETDNFAVGANWNFNITVQNVPNAARYQIVNYDIT